MNIQPQALEGLSDTDHVKTLGDDRWYTVGELRAAALRTTQEREDHAPPDTCTPPNPYAPHIAALKTTATFEDSYKADRLRAVTSTRDALDSETPEPRMAAEALAPYLAPNGYQIALDAMKEATK